MVMPPTLKKLLSVRGMPQNFKEVAKCDGYAKFGGYAECDSYGLNFKEVAKYDGFAPNFEGVAKCDCYAPNFKEVAKCDGYAPRFGEVGGACCV